MNVILHNRYVRIVRMKIFAERLKEPRTKNNLGKELARDYIREAIPTGRWSDAWGVFKSNILKLVLINVLELSV